MGEAGVLTATNFNPAAGTLASIDLLNQEAAALLPVDAPNAYEKAREAVRLSAPVGYKPGLAQAGLTQGWALLQMDRYEQAMSGFLKALSLSEELNLATEKAAALNGIGATYMRLNVYTESLQYLLRALNAYQSLRDLNGESKTLCEVGGLYLVLDEPSKALNYLDRCLEAAHRAGDRILEAAALNRLCKVWDRLGNREKAISAGLRSVEIYQSAGLMAGACEAYNSVADVHFKRQDYRQGLAFAQLARECSEKIGQRQEFARALRKIGEIQAQLRQNSLAATDLLQALAVFEELGAQQEICLTHQVLALVYKQSGDFEKALSHTEQAVQIREILFDEASDRRRRTLEVVHEVETARKDTEIYQLKYVQLQKEIEERQKAQDALERMATMDALTGVFNRRTFLELAGREFEKALRYQRPLSVIMLDVDKFKSINDLFGHIVGDQLLIRVAKQMQQVLRRVDLLGRYGGDEFVLLLPETGREGARRLAERLRAFVAGPSSDPDELDLPISLSIGVASLSGNAEKPELTLEALLVRADRALYASKQAGRNRVTGFDELAE